MESVFGNHLPSPVQSVFLLSVLEFLQQHCWLLLSMTCQVDRFSQGKCKGGAVLVIHTIRTVVTTYNWFRGSGRFKPDERKGRIF